MGWNQIPMTAAHVEKMREEDMVQTVDVPIDIPLTTKFGGFDPIRPVQYSGAIFGRNGGDAAESEGYATVAAIKAGLALHFRRQVNEMHGQYRRAVDEIPRYAKAIHATNVDREEDHENEDENEDEDEDELAALDEDDGPIDTYGHICLDYVGVCHQADKISACANIISRMLKKICAPPAWIKRIQKRQKKRNDAAKKIKKKRWWQCMVIEKKRSWWQLCSSSSFLLCLLPWCCKKASEKKKHIVIHGHGAYDDEMKRELDDQFNFALEDLRSDLEDSLMRLSQPAAEATWHATAELEEFAVTVSRLKSLFGAGVGATTNPLLPQALAKYPSQTGILPEALWVEAVSGVRTKFNSIAIDLTPIDADLCRAFTRGRGVDRFAGTQGATFYERSHTAIESMAEELKGKYRVTENPMRADSQRSTRRRSRGADSTNEMEKIARL